MTVRQSKRLNEISIFPYVKPRDFLMHKEFTHDCVLAAMVPGWGLDISEIEDAVFGGTTDIETLNCLFLSLQHLANRSDISVSFDQKGELIYETPLFTRGWHGKSNDRLPTHLRRGSTARESPAVARTSAERHPQSEAERTKWTSRYDRLRPVGKPLSYSNLLGEMEVGRLYCPAYFEAIFKAHHTDVRMLAEKAIKRGDVIPMIDDCGRLWYCRPASTRVLG
ncbi:MULTISPECIES: hypothetical protein [Paraburkholderia]|uniref:Uncharacterized protein n=1 Tax=Paraburkholderia podalyriae TaxID=1938811 RepID=A0ABR7PFP6_9BURK|nr:hypothetical protein [Paraburkholderia podalyriae]MBC8745105.1 hypothetical protein [Paraburkholderia podalyriae]